MQTGNTFPFRKIYFNLLLKFGAIPLVDKGFTLTDCTFFSDGEYSLASFKDERVTLIAILNAQKILLTKKVQRFARNIFAFRLSWLFLEFLLLFLAL